MINFVKRGMGFLKHYFVPHEHNAYKPHFFHKKSIALISLFATAVFALSLSFPLIVSRIDYLASVLPSVLIDLVNEDRSLYALTPLIRNAVLEAAAQEKANDMARFSYFAHVSPTGITPWYWFTKNGYRFIYAGENLAVNFSDSGMVNQAWMNSPGHRANILNQQFTEIGIATAEGVYQGQPTIFVAQYFGRPAVPVASLPPTPFSPTPVLAEAPAGETNIVKEPKVEPIAESQTGANSFIAVKNTEITQAEVVENEVENSKSAISSQSESTKYATIPARVLSSPNTLLHLIYYAILVIVGLAMILSLLIEFRRHHGKHLVSGLAVVVLLFALAYIYQHFSYLSVVVV